MHNVPNDWIIISIYRESRLWPYLVADIFYIMRLERGLGKREHYNPAFVSDDDGFWNEARIDWAFKASVNILYGTSGTKPG